MNKAEIQYKYETKLESNRGIIYDRYFNCLAINKPALSLAVDARKVADPKLAAAKISEVLDKKRDFYYRLLGSGKSFVWLARGLSEKTADRVIAMNIPGLQVIKESIRMYPHRRLASQVLGFTDIDNKGLSGVELVYDEVLRGRAGWAVYQKDAIGQKFADVSYPEQKPEYGKNVVLTIDYLYQSIAEEELRETTHKFRADAGMVVITNPATGEILAMAVEPSFDPNTAGKFPPETWRNRTITDVFEPGSTFKPMIMAAVLEEDIKNPEDMIFCEKGTYEIYDQTIHDIKKYGWLSLQKVLKYSSNIGMVKIAQEIDKKLLYQYIRDFGFGVRSGIELNGEVEGELKNTVEWSEFTPLAMAMGYEISVTALQMAMAYGVIANGGLLLKPKIFWAENTEEGEKLKPVKPEIIRRVLSEKTARTLAQILEEAVNEGTGTKARIKGLRIAGKTGTARKYEPDNNSYSDNKFVSSFAGFFPVNNSQILIFVMIDNPKLTYWGGEVAAPTFKRILQRIVNTGQLDRAIVAKPSEEKQKKAKTVEVVVPNLIKHRLEVAQKIIENLGLRIKVVNEGELVQSQNPLPGTAVPPNSVVTVTLFDVNGKNEGYTTTPKVVGLTIREALDILALENIEVVINGSGLVVRQEPKAGEKIKVGGRCLLECEPPIDLSLFKVP